MRIILNGQAQEVTANTLDAVLLECGYEGDHFATALNGTFIHKQQREGLALSADDRIEVVAPLEGG